MANLAKIRHGRFGRYSIWMPKVAPWIMVILTKLANWYDESSENQPAMANAWEGLFWQIWHIWRTWQIWRTPAKVLTKIQMTWQSPLKLANLAILANMAKMMNLMLKGPLWLWLFWQKWRIWRKFCHRFGEYSNWVAEGVPWIVDFVENGKSGENTKNAKVSQGSFAEH